MQKFANHCPLMQEFKNAIAVQYLQPFHEGQRGTEEDAHYLPNSGRDTIAKCMSLASPLLITLCIVCVLL
jgi:hypothetical protein